MKRKTILIFFIALLLLVNFAFIASSVLNKDGAATRFFTGSTAEIKKASYKIPPDKIKQTKNAVAKNNFNDRICFMIDMRLPSGNNRFFVYDLKKDSIISSGLVTHGRCNERWLEGRKYGNVVGCGCTSLGRYKIGNPYYGRFGLAYKLYGLDSTNNKAFERFVVLHSHECVPEKEQEDDICQSDGCPTVSPKYLKALQKIIDKSDKPIMLLIYG